MKLFYLCLIFREFTVFLLAVLMEQTLCSAFVQAIVRVKHFSYNEVLL